MQEKNDNDLQQCWEQYSRVQFHGVPYLIVVICMLLQSQMRTIKQFTARHGSKSKAKQGNK